MRRMNRYYFDENTIQYIEVKVNWKHRLLQGLMCLLISGVLTVATYPIWIQIEEQTVRTELSTIHQTIHRKHKKLVTLEHQLNKIHTNDQAFYRSILNQERMEESVWEQAKGGQVITPSAVPDYIQNIQTLIGRLQNKVKLQSESFEKIHHIAKIKSEELKHIPAIKPIPGNIVSGFGYRPDPFHGHVHFHAGIDIVARMGTKIKSTGDGVILTAGTPEMGYGLQVEVDHGYGYVTKYAHLSGVNVQVGQKIKRGDVIGFSGNSGYSTGPHLHYEVIKNGTKVNPFDYFYAE